MTNAEYILEFINSNTVRDYLKNANYEPDSLTAAYIVWQSKSHTLAQKEEAFEWIIKNMPDMEIPEHVNHKRYESLHDFLAEYNDYIGIQIQSFEFDDPGVAYNFSVYYKEDHQWVSDDNLYSSYDKVIAAAKEFCNDEDCPAPHLIKVRRRIIDFDLGSDYLYFTPSFEQYEFEQSPQTMSNDDYEITSVFENLCPYIPHPFKKGDIIRECAGKYALPTYYNDMLTVTGFYSEDYVRSHQNSLGMHDYTLYGICSDGEGGSYEDSINHYLYAELVNPGDVLIKDWILLEKAEEVKNGN